MGWISDACRRLPRGRCRYGCPWAFPGFLLLPRSLTGPGSLCTGDRDGERSRPTPEPSPVHEMEIFLQEAGIHGALAELQLRLGVVVHIVDAHLLQDAEAPLPGRKMPVSSAPFLPAPPSASGVFILFMRSFIHGSGGAKRSSVLCSHTDNRFTEWMRGAGHPCPPAPTLQVRHEAHESAEGPRRKPPAPRRGRATHHGGQLPVFRVVRTGSDEHIPLPSQVDIHPSAPAHLG